MHEAPSKRVIELGAKLVRVAFLERYVRCFPLGTFVQVVAIHPESGEVRVACAARDDLASLLSFIDEHASEWNLYFGVNPLRAPKATKATKDDVAALCVLHVDKDPRPGLDVATEHQNALGVLRDFRPKPSLLISSGHGLQAFWLLAEPVLLEGDAGRLEKDNKLLERLLGGDHCHNLDRVMRLPGTTNFPNERKRARGYGQAPAVVLDFNNSTYELAEFGANLLPVSDETKELIRHGDTAGKYASRSDALMRVAGDLVRAGVSEETICDICLDPSHEISAHALAQKDPKRAVLRAIGNAARGGPNDDWHRDLVRNDKGKILADERNVMHALRNAPELHGLLRFNEFALQIEFVKSPPWRDAEPDSHWRDEDDTELLAWLQARGVAYRSTNGARNCVAVAARDNSVHPVREFLNALTWDGTKRLSGWLGRYLNATGPTAYLEATGRAFLVAAVARVFAPGCKADCMLVLEGVQGAFKSTAAEKLAGNPDWFVDSIGDVRNKDSAIQLAGHWIVEFAELAAISKAELESIKAFITRKVDKYRPPYGRTAVAVPRQCVFVGTTNQSIYLKDPTGNRRYWPVQCGKADIEALEHDREQLWAEALWAYRSGERWWLSDEVSRLAEREQGERVVESEIEATVAEFVAKQREFDPRRKAITTRHVYGAFGLEKGTASYHNFTRMHANDVANALLRAGCTKYRQIGRGETKRTVYLLPGFHDADLTPHDLAETLKIPQGEM